LTAFAELEAAIRGCGELELPNPTDEQPAGIAGVSRVGCKPLLARPLNFVHSNGTVETLRGYFA
jgi:hypothetical protein